jgi:hypothetical protein
MPETIFYELPTPYLTFPRRILKNIENSWIYVISKLGSTMVFTLSFPG